MVEEGMMVFVRTIQCWKSGFNGFYWEIWQEYFLEKDREVDGVVEEDNNELKSLESNWMKWNDLYVSKRPFMV